MSRDPYQIERLADDLAARDSNRPPSEISESVHELPLLEPLSHSLLGSSGQFDVDAFLLTRPHTSLPDLRTELREYSAKLKEELVQLINADYAAFISLSTDLRGEGARLQRIAWPLNGLKAEIEVRRGIFWCDS